MMRSSILGASTMLNVLIQHLPLQSLFWTKIWRAFRASDPSTAHLTRVYCYQPLGSRRYFSRPTGPRPPRLARRCPYEGLFTSFSAFQMLSTAEARILGIKVWGVVRRSIQFGAGQAGQGCMHIAVLTMPALYPFLLNLGLWEV